ncbi:hypothetical protein AMTRI_Chr12g266860 [Amborella trichopoda]|uniref:CP-type G domain-containing protein n=1 Tax=Amborella trichopoda TaxID=13333 RepID=W1NVM3_AMBTC|nr:GTPase LSG1-1 [Amborella trichopoda]ERM99388.1 hypothetical protein AMTR_s00131p00025250 [Amborella trichopoda]|eukprot:XP_006836535.1 GTPase LSG1-1 [Amborella trichopoda]
MSKNHSGKSGIGRALVKHHNHLIQQSKEKGTFNRRQNKQLPLESVTDIKDIEAVIEQAEEAGRIFSSANPDPDLLINLDLNSENGNLTGDERREQQKEEALYRSNLRVPRRPPWNPSMSVDELDANEKQSFLTWRRSLARLEENEKLVLTPFEKNLDIWRQLWRVLERSDLVVMVVDARDPLFYRCPDLEAYVQEIDKHKRTLLLVNKADLLPSDVRESWAKYFHTHDIPFIFWSAKAASAALQGEVLSGDWDHHDQNANAKVYSKEELLARLQSEAEAIVTARIGDAEESLETHSPKGNLVGFPDSKHVTVGFVGYPNVGKSSTINALVGEKRTGVTSTPGKTKHFQTFILSDKLVICDCPGLVFPSFSSSRYEMIASGVLPIDRMTEHRGAVQVVANRVPRAVLQDVYNIALPKPKAYEPQSRPPLASELLGAYCMSRGYVGSRGLPDETRAARQILKDYIDGKLPHYEMPLDHHPVSSTLGEENGNPNGTYLSFDREDGFHISSCSTIEDQNAPPSNDVDDIEHVLKELDSFDGSFSGTAKEKKAAPQRASHKLHMKPARRKDRSWRVGSDGSDGMPMVGVFQKEVSYGAAKTSSKFC